MTTEKKPAFEDNDEGPYHQPFDFINKDLDLLFLLIFIEAFKANKEELNFGDFFKGEYWDIDQVSEEISDTNDYYSIPDMVIEQALFVFEDMRMGKVIEVGIDNTDEAAKDLLIEVAKIGPENAKKEAPAYYSSLEQLFFLSQQKRDNLIAQFEKSPHLYTHEILKDKSVFFTKERGYFRALQTLFIDVPSHILIRVTYDSRRIVVIEKEIEEYLDAFSKDHHIQNLPTYQEKRLYFAQQVENFYRYISKLNLIGDVINIPFTILTETGFEAVKILHYFEIKGVLKIRWSDEGSWKVQFLKLPITPETLLGTFKGVEMPKTENKLKSALSFNETTSELAVDGHTIKIQGPDQKELLRIIFKDPKELKKEWFFSEIVEQYDFANDVSEKKFYNAAYQLNLKIAQKTPIRDCLITTKQSVQVNPKYL